MWPKDREELEVWTLGPHAAVEELRRIHPKVPVFDGVVRPENPGRERKLKQRALGSTSAATRPE